VAEVTVSVRVISTQTAQIFMAEQVNNKQTHSLGKGGKVGNNGSDNGSISAHPGAMAANLAVQGAADDIASKIIARADALPSRSGGSVSSNSSKKSTESSAHDGGSSSSPARIPDNASLQVGRVDGTKIYLTGGENAGVKLNDNFEVRRVSGKMKDGQGNDIEMDEKIESIVVTDVQEKFSVAKAVSGTTVAKVGDRLKRVKAPAAVKKAPAAASGLPAPVQRKQ
jgi:hypothetical protein